MGPKRKLSADQERDLAARYIAGESINAIAKSTGLPNVSVSRTLKRCGVATRPETLRPALPPEQREQLVEDHLRGKTLEWVADKYGVAKMTAWRIVKEEGASKGRTGRPRSCTLREDAFDIITPESARWMGFLFADGCLPRHKEGQQSLAVNLGAKDRGHLKKMRQFLGSNHAITKLYLKERQIGTGKTTPPGIAFGYRVRSNRLAGALIKRGMIKEKGPERTPSAELEDVPAFWAGALDGDGCIGVDPRGYPYMSLCGHIPLLAKFQSFLANQKIGRFNIHKTDSGIFRIATSGNAAFCTIELLYAKESESAGLERKIVRAQQILRGETPSAYLEGPVETFLDSETSEEITPVTPATK